MSQIHGYGAFGSGKKYYGYNAEQYNPITGNQNLRARQLNIRRQRFLTEDTYIGKKNNSLTLNRFIYGNDNPLKYKDPSGNFNTKDILFLGPSLSVGIRANQFVNNNIDAIVEDAKVFGQVVTNTISTYGNLIYNTTDKISFARITSNVLTKSVRLASNLTNLNLDSCYSNDYYSYKEFYDPDLPDYTDAINELLDREEQNYINYRNCSYAGQGISDLIGLGGFGSLAARARNMIYFYDQEKTMGRLDIKVQKRWERAFDNEVPWLGVGINNPSARFLYNEEVMTADILGNVAYGYWGKALGFTDDEIYYGGGFAELKKQNEKTTIEFISDPDLMANWALDPLYGDAPEDHYAIKRGIDLYNERH